MEQTQTDIEQANQQLIAQQNSLASYLQYKRRRMQRKAEEEAKRRAEEEEAQRKKKLAADEVSSIFDMVKED